jgi:hypothetical protein
MVPGAAYRKPNDIDKKESDDGYVVHEEEDD